MKIILGSIASNIIGKTKDIFEKPFGEITLAVIPTAANTYPKDNRPWFDNELKVFEDLGFKLKIIEVEDKNQEEIAKELEGIDALFVTGGNTYYLLYHVKKSGLFELIKEKVNQGVVYIGSSAGSILAGLSIDIARRFDDPNMVDLENYKGLSLVDTLILPHFDKKKYTKELEETVEEWEDKGYKITTLNDNQAFVVNEDKEYLI